jgi:hypothetical protein
MRTGYVATFMTTRSGRRVGMLLSLATLVACASPPYMKAARSGDEAALRGALAALRASGGRLSNGDAASLASVVASRDVRTATGADAVVRVREVQACGRELDDVLSERAAHHDDAGARAALVRIESGRLDPDQARSFVADANPEWRAVGARGLVRSEDREKRRSAFLDADPRIRRQAVRAAREGADPTDLEALAEVARLDPEPIVRTEAVRALAAQPPASGRRVALILSDLWASADEGLRESIARAWASPQVWSAGGSDALRLVVASEHDPGSIEGAAAVLLHADASSELTDLAASRMASAIETGSQAGRLQAILQAPLDRPNVRGALRSAAQSDDRRVRAAALGRLAHDDPEALATLEALARPGQPGGLEARLALAFSGDRRVEAWIEQDLGLPMPSDRLAAAAGLAALGSEARGAALLADDDPSVRVRAACTIMMGARVYSRP